MSALLTTPITITWIASDPNMTLANCPVIELGADKRLSIECLIDNGTDGQAPTDNPQGSFQLYFSADKNTPLSFVRNLIAETATPGQGYLVDIAPNGNALVKAVANFTDCPCRYAIVLPVRTGGTTARARLFVTVGTN